MSRVYIAGSSGEISRAVRAARRLELAGVEVTSTWMHTIPEVGEANPSNASRQQRAEWSMTCLRQVLESQAVLLLTPHEAAGRGAYFEAGLAFHAGRPIVAAGLTTQSIFNAMALIECATDDEAIDRVGSLVRGGGRQPHHEALEAMEMDLRVKQEMVRG